LIQHSFFEAIKENNLEVVGSPEIATGEFDSNGPFKYDATVEIRPEIADIDYKGLSLEKKLYEVSDEEVQTQLKILQKNLAELKPISEDRPLREGDFALIDYEGFKDGKPFPETQKTENFTIKIGEGRISKDFDKALVGMRPGENREVKVHFPEDYFNTQLANQTIIFQTTLKEIREEDLPEIDDKLAKNLGNYETLEELKKEITKNLTQGYAKRVERELNDQIFEALIAKTDFEVPQILIKYELDGIMADFERSFASRNASMESLGITRQKISEQYRETAEKQARRHLILDKLIAQEKVAVSDEDLKIAFEEMSETFKQPFEKIKSFYGQNSDKLDVLKQTLLEKKAIKLIIDHGDVKEVKPEAKRAPENQAENKEK
jgi:trigger factor